MGGDIFLVENGVSEAVYCWGNSINKELFELLFNIVYLDLRGCFKLHILCLDGTRQIAAGIYVFSGGGLTYGIVTSGSILYCFPLNKTSF